MAPCLRPHLWCVGATPPHCVTAAGSRAPLTAATRLSAPRAAACLLFPSQIRSPSVVCLLLPSQNQPPFFASQSGAGRLPFPAYSCVRRHRRIPERRLDPGATVASSPLRLRLCSTMTEPRPPSARNGAASGRHLQPCKPTTPLLLCLRRPSRLCMSHVSTLFSLRLPALLSSPRRHSPPGQRLEPGPQPASA
jgi:hypothetical protein